jgi:hypothetical protein
MTDYAALEIASIAEFTRFAGRSLEAHALFRNYLRRWLATPRPRCAPVVPLTYQQAERVARRLGGRLPTVRELEAELTPGAAQQHMGGSSR